MAARSTPAKIGAVSAVILGGAWHWTTKLGEHIILTWAASTLGVGWSAPKLALLVAAILGGACTFCGLFVLGAALAFWTVEVLEVWNAVTYGGTETGQYPLAVYRPWFR